MSSHSQIFVGMALVVASSLLLGNMAISWLMPSDTKKIGLLDLVKLFDNYKSALNDEELRQALAILSRDKGYFDQKVSVSLLLTAMFTIAASTAAVFFTGSLLTAAIVLVVGLTLTIPVGVKLAKATVIQAANTEREAFRSILSMYLTVLGVELRSHPIEIALRDIAEVTYSPISLRITQEIQNKIDTVTQASIAEGTLSDMSLGSAMIELGRDWAIPELELIGEIMHGSVFSPEALSEMILQQAETMKKTMMRDYAKKIEAQRPKLSMFALLQVMPLIVFLVIPIMASFSKTGI